VSRSLDGGATFGPPARVGDTPASALPGVRWVPIPSAAVASDGRVLVAWPACRPEQCAANEVVVAASADGGQSWAPPVRVAAAGSAFMPAVAGGPDGRVALLFHTLRREGIDVWLARSADGGRSFGRAQRLSARTMPLGWIAVATGGRMLGDYVGIAYAGTRPVPVFALASPPTATGLRQATVATERVG
jgi:hypothetical protein